MYMDLRIRFKKVILATKLTIFCCWFRVVTVVQLVRDCSAVVIMVLLPPLSLMDVLEVATKVATLGECLVAVVTRERPLTCMLSKVVSQVARLFEYTVASGVHAFKVQFDSLCIRISYLDCLMPFSWNTLEGL